MEQTTIYGLKVVINDNEVPGYVLPPDSELSLPPAFRKQFEDWAWNFFKRNRVLPDGRVVRAGDMFVMNSKTHAQMKRAAETLSVPTAHREMMTDEERYEAILQADRYLIRKRSQNAKRRR